MTAIRADLSDTEFVVGLPKAELHVHLEGTIEPQTLLEIADRNGVELPYDSPEGIVAFQAERRSSGRENLVNFLECLDISRGAMRTADDYLTVTREFLARCRDEGVAYVEIMFDPQQAIRQGVALGECIEAITQGRADAHADHAVTSQLIMCFQRDHPPEDAARVLAASDSWRDDIVGVGLDNYETPGFPAMFAPVYELARERDYRLTSHCDVNQPDSLDHIRSCIEDLGVERLDHGLNTVDDPSLVELVLENDIVLTGCPTFYDGQRSSPAFRLEMHRTLLEAGVRISLNTDDPAQFGSGWLSNTVEAAMVHAPFSRSEIVRFNDNAISGAWIDDATKAALRTSVAEFLDSTQPS